MTQPDPRKLRPAELVRIVNSTALGKVITAAELGHHRNEAGYRIGDAKTVDLPRYAAWLIARRHSRVPKDSASTAYDKLKEAAAKRSKEISQSGRDIAPIPPVANPARKESCRLDFKLFCETYHPQTFFLPWSEDHLKVIGQVQTSVLEGGLFATAMPRGSGKALDIRTPLPTPSGWKTMGEIHPGDMVYDEAGEPCCVMYATHVMESHPCYRVTFDDGESVVCDADHLWTVEDRFSRKNPLTLRTEDMAPRYILSTGRGWTEYRYTIPVSHSLSCESPPDWMVSPYVLGAWLGDGTTANGNITIGDRDSEEMRSLIERHESLADDGQRKPDSHCGTYLVGTGRVFSSPDRLELERKIIGLKGEGVPSGQISRLTGSPRSTVQNVLHRKRGDALPTTKDVALMTRLRWLGVLGNKHIPMVYLRASEEDRLELLRGLMDTDGSINSDGNSAEYVTKLPRLRDDMMELLASLGFKRRYFTKTINDRPYYRITFAPTDGRRVFNLARKSDRQVVHEMRISSTRRITGIEPVPSVPVRCIQVDSKNHLYLCGKGMIPTHNTSLMETACQWAIFYGHRRFVVLICSDENNALGMLNSIKTEFETNDLLHEDFPEAIYPIRSLDGIALRAKGQLLDGKRTHIEWTGEKIVMPTVPGSEASGALIVVGGITGGLRGIRFKRADGETIRPDLILIDDPQTDQSARSPSQCDTRERILKGAILGMAGPGCKISGLMPCTVIADDDMADRFLDRDKHPEWNGTRTEMLYSFPDNMKLWEEYARMRADSMRAEHGGREATEFYRENRGAMDVGSRVAWEERHDPDELSALQHAMNLLFDRGEDAFWAEYQNKPRKPDTSREDDLTPGKVCSRVNRYRQRLVPISCNHVTAFIDVQATLLFHVVVAWEDDFTGYIVDYGSFPDQKRPYFTLADAKVKLSNRVEQATLEGQITEGLKRLTFGLMSQDWTRDDGAGMKIERLLIDANWGTSTDLIYQFCRESPYSAVLMPSHGKYVGASSMPMREYSTKPGDRLGLNWIIPNVQGKRAVRHVTYDTNYWKSFIHSRFNVPIGDPGGLTIFGDDPDQHAMFADHICSEYRVRTQGRGREVDEFKLRPQRPDNHWLDGLAGTAVAASIQGVKTPETFDSRREDRASRVSFAELQRRAREQPRGPHPTT